MADEQHSAPRIQLEGAHLRPFGETDAAALYAYLRDPRVTELTSYPAVSLSLAEAMIARANGRWAANELSRWAIALEPGDQLVGTCGFNDHSAVHRWTELAFDLAPAQWGTGLMRRAVSAVLDWAYTQDRVNRVHAFVRVDNERSRRLLERNGFTREGCLRSYRVCRGHAHDFYVYSMLRSDWLTAPGRRGVEGSS